MGWNNRYDITDGINSSSVVKDDSYFWGELVSFCLFFVVGSPFYNFLETYISFSVADAFVGIGAVGYIIARIVWGQAVAGFVTVVGFIMLVYKITH